MTSRALLPLLLLAALAVAGYWLLGPAGRGAPTPPPAAPAPAEPAPTVPAPAPAAPAEPRVQRVAVPADPSHADAPQGVKGRVLLPGGAPAAGVPVYLLECMLNDPVRLFLASRTDGGVPPVAAGATAADGTFALGIRAADKAYDLRVASDAHPELDRRSIRVHADDWYDTGDLTLDAGTRVRGRVVDGRTGAGIAGAAVFLTTSGHDQSLPTPGRARGLACAAGADGTFAFASAPTTGLFDLTAEAPGYATDARRALRAGDGSGPGFLLELTPGLPLAGVAVDGTGAPLRGVRVVVRGLSAKTPQTAEATTGDDGRFALDGLREGPYELTATSPVHVDATAAPVLAGETEVKLVLAERPAVRLRILGADGAPVRECRIGLKRHFPNQPLAIGNVDSFPDRMLTAGDFPAELGGDLAVVHGVPAGDFVFQIQDRRHAKSLSEPFRVPAGGEPVEVTARLTLGGAIVGTVLDEDGRPLPGAVVRTDLNRAPEAGNELFDTLRRLLPERHTQAQRRTDAKGRFRLERLAFADYMIRVAHPDYCRGALFDVRLEREGQVVDVGAVQLHRGTVLEGFTTVADRAAGQVKVAVAAAGAAAATPVGQPSAPSSPFAATAISDSDGRYRLLQRVPPGTYTVHAVRAAIATNPFEVILDIRATERTIAVPPGQDRLQIDFQLPAR